MARTPRKQRRSGNPLRKSAGRIVPVAMQMAILKKRVDQLTTALAALRAECVRQSDNGDVIFPAPARVQMSAGENSLTLDAAGLAILSAGQVSVDGSSIDLSTALLSGNAAMSKFSGVVQCDTLIAASVVAASYTPGAGNIW